MGKLTLQESTDLELIARYQSDLDSAALEELLTRYHHLIYGACYKVLGSQDDAKDVCMEICTFLCESLKTAKIEYFSTWLFSVCHNRSVTYIRKRETRRKYERVPEESEKSGENFVENRMLQRLSPEEPDVSRIDLAKDQLGTLMSRLPSAQRFCLQLFYFKNMSYAQIADATNTEIKQVKSHLQSGKRKLRILYEQDRQRAMDQG